jgi:hypothetical protein
LRVHLSDHFKVAADGQAIFSLIDNTINIPVTLKRAEDLLLCGVPENIHVSINPYIQISYDKMGGMIIPSQYEIDYFVSEKKFEAEELSIRRRFNQETRIALSGAITLPKKWQGVGLGTRIMMNHIDFSKEVGMRSLNVFAGKYLGGYVWSSMGIVLDDDQNKTFAFNRVPQILDVLTILKPILSKKVVKDITSMLQNYDEKITWNIADYDCNVIDCLKEHECRIFKRCSKDDLSKIKNMLAEHENETGKLIGDKLPLGALLLKRMNISGVVHFNDDTQMKRINDYVAKRFPEP